MKGGPNNLFILFNKKYNNNNKDQLITKAPNHLNRSQTTFLEASRDTKHAYNFCCNMETISINSIQKKDKEARQVMIPSFLATKILEKKAAFLAVSDDPQQH